jgi:transposase-like protein
MQCPKCGSTRIIKNGSTRHHKQKYQCNECHRQFVEKPQSRAIPSDKLEINENLLLERISLAGIARAVGVSIRWRQNSVNRKLKQIPVVVQVPPKSKGRLRMEAEERHSDVGSKSNTQWLWFAQDTQTREMVGGRKGRGTYRVRPHSFNLYHQCLANARFVTRRGWRPTKRCSPQPDINLPIKVLAKPIILKDLITLFVNVSLV